MCVVDREIACPDVDLADFLIIDRHFQPLILTETLIAVVALAVEPATLVPIERRVITLVEHSDIAPVRATAKVEAVDKLV